MPDWRDFIAILGVVLVVAASFLLIKPNISEFLRVQEADEWLQGCLAEFGIDSLIERIPFPPLISLLMLLGTALIVAAACAP